MTAPAPDNSAADTFYARTAEYVAVLLESAWESLGPTLAAALDGLDPAAGPVVDVGAGSGLGTRVIARALPATEIFAVEPDRALRTALLATIAADSDLRARVTVLDTDLLSADLPDRVGGLVAMNVLGHFPPTERTRLWALLAERLAPQGRAVLDLYPPHRPEAVPATPMADIVLGRRHYSGVAAAEPGGADAIIWEMSYRVEQDGRPVASLSAHERWYVLSPGQLADELGAHGLRLRTHGATDTMFVIDRGPASRR
ncbi:class I SAM-dependent methyltransferase [Pseudonocardia hispaniensis]|uniref:Class I SAM-dependent methyltransferase n=1 Tax=Pseudonocardia hispaniensis TaxID=904933 RepID=A0ABW1J7P4_9PSEU